MIRRLSGITIVQVQTPILLIFIDSGAGPIGLTTLLSARAAGAEPIVITDLFQNRLDFAKKLVPTVRTVLIERDLSLEDQAAKIKTAAGTAFRVGLECTGVESSIATAAYVCPHSSSLDVTNSVHILQTIKFGGTLMVIGVGKSPQTVSQQKYHASIVA